MTAINVIRTAHSIHVITDGAALKEDGTLAWLCQKVFALPHLSAVIATTGLAGSTEILGEMLCHRASSFDELVADGPWVADRVRRYLEYVNDPGPLDVVIAGWSRERQRPEIWFMRAPAETLDDFSNMPGLTIPPVSAEEAQAAGLSLVLSDYDNAAFCKSMIDLVELQRTLHRTIGGFVQITTVCEDGCIQRIIHRWPDKIGEVIQAVPIHPDVLRAAQIAEQRFSTEHTMVH